MRLPVNLTYFTARGIAAGLQLATLVVLTRLLTPADYGPYALAVTWAGVLHALGSHWLSAGALRFGASPTVRVEALVGTLLPLQAGVLAALGLGCVVLAVAPLAGGVPPQTLWSVLLLVSGLAAFDLATQLAIARTNPNGYLALTVTKAILAFGLAAWVASRGLGGIPVVWAVAAAQIIPAACALVLSRRRLQLEQFDPALATRLVRYGAPLAATTGANALAAAADRMVLAAVASASAVGTYASAHDLASQGMTLLMVTLNFAAYPRAIRAAELGDTAGARAHLRRSAELLLAIGLPAAAGLWMLSGPVAALVLGAGFQDQAAGLIGTLALAALLAGLKAYYYDLAFQLARRTSAQAVIAWVVVAIAVPANAVLASRMGSTGSALAALLAGACGLASSAWFGRRYFRLTTPWIGWGKVALATAAMVGFLASLPDGHGIWQLSWRIAGAAAVYVAALVALDAADARSLLRRHRGAGELS
jgi:O-antigen/teichoic acid export membrane protein